MAVVDQPGKGPSPDDLAFGPLTPFKVVFDLISGREKKPSFKDTFPRSPEFNDPVLLGKSIARDQAKIAQRNQPLPGLLGRKIGAYSESPLGGFQQRITEEIVRIKQARLGVLDSRINTPIQSGPIYASVIPPGVTDIFKGTPAGKTIGKVVSKGPRGRVAPGRIGGIITAGAIVGSAMIDAINAQKKLEDEAYKKAAKAQEKSDNAKVRKIQQDREDRIRAEERAFQKSEREARQKERETIRNAKATAKAIRRRIEAGVRADKQLAKEVDRELKARARAAEKARRAAQKAKAAKVRLVFSAIGAGIRLKIAKKGGSGSRSVFNINQPALGRDNFVPDFAFDRGADFSSLRDDQFSNASAEARTATKTKVQKCRTDTPKRKKGVCRSGFFRETPSKTTYKVWSTRKCL
jgi:hypothetical protein